MLDMVAWTWYLTLTSCAAMNVDVGLPGGLLEILGFGKELPTVGNFQRLTRALSCHGFSRSRRHSRLVQGSSLNSPKNGTSRYLTGMMT